MTRVRGTVWMGAAALFAVPAPAAAQDICAALARIAAAARERPAFDSLRRSLAAGEAVVPGFQTGDCSIDKAISCEDASFNFRNFDGWPDPLTCPGLTPVAPNGPRPGRRDRQHAYLFSGLRIEYGFSCWGCAGGPHSYFHAASERSLGE